MGLLYLLSYVAAVVAVVYVVLSLASGLLWIAELIEEHSRLAKTVGQRAIWVIVIIHLLLYFDGLPPTHIAFSIFCHFVYSRNITPRWPLISLTSPSFILSCIFVFVDHALFFNYFSQQKKLARQRGRAPLYYRDAPIFANGREYSFGEIATFFAICVWAIPLFLFLGLSANENTLPIQQTTDMSGSSTAGRGEARTRASLLRRILDPLLSLLPNIQNKRQEGIIAPASPIAPASYPTSPGGMYGTPPSPGINGTWVTIHGQSYVTGPAISSPPPPRVRRTVVRDSSRTGKED
ncbi:SubName: Full=Related to SVP26-Sed5-Vesicle Protein of 26 kDa {ECO:0000313/EMBL:CCA72541.1} [Serendipita indica DSM 11827]|uniref:Related to SVP26-Sed5-Vesicle Protein of 26 kDa n=1 Tax=Serendipita indica (strain DSM 11827) TaxID=1109443 RepID=G4TMJ8_SERID|nr:SubName: Full=Related to SVP26-Sed5-Vesicle Protein of 26 kDa {ECO:0000313/EMBL:CCA72541.1} [Serendipita indica DSM 11827]CCA72541.1 related to SVP26-Sed5-Vesicle Protein of 26 kDa [Serendipita indica DSM 11827]